MRYTHLPDGEAPIAAAEAARDPRAGFTLVELLIIMALIGTLSMLIIPRLFGFAERVRVTQALVDLREMDVDINQFIMDNNTPPADLNQVGYGNLRDPWGNPYEYLNIIAGGPGVAGKRRKDHFLVPVNSDYDLYSMGPDGKSKAPFTAAPSRDDIVRASNGSWIGPVSEF
jgi:general secretion pathway protein G